MQVTISYINDTNTYHGFLLFFLNEYDRVYPFIIVKYLGKEEFLCAKYTSIATISDKILFLDNTITLTFQYF